jgi:hypothetical protein
MALDRSAPARAVVVAVDVELRVLVDGGEDLRLVVVCEDLHLERPLGQLRRLERFSGLASVVGESRRSKLDTAPTPRTGAQCRRERSKRVDCEGSRAESDDRRSPLEA